MFKLEGNFNLCHLRTHFERKGRWLWHKCIQNYCYNASNWTGTDTGTQICTETIGKRLQHYQFTGKRTVKKLFAEELETVLFSDESRFCLKHIGWSSNLKMPLRALFKLYFKGNNSFYLEMDPLWFWEG